MSSRYGSKTRTTEPVAGYGQRATAGGSNPPQVFEETFLAPGTWTKPATATQVDLFLVGGGGGGGVTGDPAPTLGIPNITAGGGGGGGIRFTYNVPVSGPVPVTIGAGGAGGIYSPTTITNAGIGGTTAFGPLGPGPVPLIPAPTIYVDGGGRGANSWVPGTASAPRFSPQPSVPTNAPPMGGGGGGGGYNSGDQTGGGYGQPGADWQSPVGKGGGGGGQQRSAQIAGGRGWNGYGGGGAAYGPGGSGAAYDGGGIFYSPNVVPPAASSNGRGWTNRGGGGAGAVAGNESGHNGGSGILIVRWQE